jgi:hypothetical protein
VPAAPNTAAGTGRMRRRPRKPPPTSIRYGSARSPRTNRAGGLDEPVPVASRPQPRSNERNRGQNRGRNRGRNRRRRPNPLYDPVTQLSGRRLRRAARDLVALEVNPQRAALEREGAQTQAQGSALQATVGNEYQQLAAGEAERLARSQAISQSLHNSIAATGQQAQQQLAQIGQQAQQLNAASPVTAGLPVGERTQEELVAAQARGVANQQQAGIAAAGQGANYQGLVDLTQRATQLQGQQSQQTLAMQLAAQMADVRGRRADLEAKVGPAKREAVMDLRQQAYENLVTQAGLDIKSRELRAEQQSEQRDARLARQRIRQADRASRRSARTQRRGQNVTVRGQDVSSQTQQRGQNISAETQRRGQNVTAQQRAADRATRERIARMRGRTGMSTQAAKTRVGIDNVVTDITTEPRLQRALRENRLDDIRNLIVNERGAPPIVGKAGLEIAKHGHLFPDTMRALRRAGVRIPKSWRYPKSPSHYDKTRGAGPD